MRGVRAPARIERQTLIVLLQRGVVAALGAPHPFAPTFAMMQLRRCEPAEPTRH